MGKKLNEYVFWTMLIILLFISIYWISEFLIGFSFMLPLLIWMLGDIMFGSDVK